MFGARKFMAARSSKSIDIVVLMYISGIMGVLKGVMLNYFNVCVMMIGFKDVGDFINKDVYLAYLSLVYIMEMAAETVMFVFGVVIGYGLL